MPLNHLEQLPKDEEDSEAIHIVVDQEFSRFIYDPLIVGAERPDTPSWCIALVELLKFVSSLKSGTSSWVGNLLRPCNRTLN